MKAIRVKDESFGDMLLKIPTESRVNLDDITVYRHEGVQFSLNQGQDAAPLLYTVVGFADSEYGENYGDDDWKYQWPSPVTFKPRNGCRFRSIVPSELGITDDEPVDWDFNQFRDDHELRDTSSLEYDMRDALETMLKDIGYTLPDGESMESLLSADKGSALSEELAVMFAGVCIWYSPDTEEPLYQVNESDIWLQHDSKMKPGQRDRKLFTADAVIRYITGCNVEDLYGAVCNYVQECYSLDDLHEIACIPDKDSPLVVLPGWAYTEVDVYQHSGSFWSYPGQGMNCRFDTTHSAGVLYIDPKWVKTAGYGRTRYYKDGKIELRENGLSEEELIDEADKMFKTAMGLMSDDELFVIPQDIHFNSMGEHVGTDSGSWIYYDQDEGRKEYLALMELDDNPQHRLKRVDFEIVDIPDEEEEEESED